MSGTSSIAPMMLYYSDDACSGEHAQFMVREQVLVAPVTTPGDVQRTIYLPDLSGGWYAYAAENESMMRFDGNQSVTVDAPLGQLPIFVRSGTVLPIATHWNESTPHDATSVFLKVFVDSASGVISEKIFFDDGQSWHFQSQDASLLQVDVDWNVERVQVKVAEECTGRARPALSVSVVGLENRTLVFGLP